jgi:hypothetical protein
MVRDSNKPMLRPHSGATSSSLLLLALLALPACGSSESAQFNNLGGSATAGGGADGGGGVNGGTAGASGAQAAGGAQGGSDAGRAGMSSGGEAGSGGASRGGAGAGGSGGSGGAFTRGCPASAPSAGTPCPTLAGVTCYYDDCGASGTKKKAACVTAIPEVGNPQQLWTVQTFPCGQRVDCGNLTCDADQVCVILQGGAQIGQCSKQSCGSGSIECSCVQGCFPGCVMSSIGNDVTFTCSTCSDIRGCP